MKILFDIGYRSDVLIDIIFPLLSLYKKKVVESQKSCKILSQVLENMSFFKRKKGPQHITVLRVPT